jgi:hypothetical protein
MLLDLAPTCRFTKASADIPENARRRRPVKVDARKRARACARFWPAQIPAPPYPCYTARSSVHEGAPLEGVSCDASRGPLPGSSRKEPPGGDTSWLVLARAPGIPQRQRGRTAPLLIPEPWRSAPPLPSPPISSGAKPREEKSAARHEQMQMGAAARGADSGHTPSPTWPRTWTVRGR